MNIIFPHIKADIGVRLDGVDPSLENALPGNTEIRYDLCPNNGNGQCAQSWLPLTIYSVPNEPTGHSRVATVSTLAGEHERTFSHDLFAEQNTLTALLSGGSWSNYTSLIVRACINTTRSAEPSYQVSAFEALTEAPGFGQDANSTNNCRTVIVDAVHPATREASIALRDAVLRNTTSLDFSESDSHYWGSHSTIGVQADFGTTNYLDFSGAHSHTSSDVDLEGWLDITLFSIDAEANALVSVVGSNIDFKVVGLDQTLYSFSKEIPEYHYSKDWEVAKKYCGTFSYGIYILSLDVDVCATGKMGFETDLDIVAKDGTGTGIFADAATIGSIEPEVKPYLDFDGSASAYASVALARAGVEADIAILDQSLPVTGNLEWGLTDEAHLVVHGNIKMEAELDSLNGRLFAFADVQKVSWCHHWHLSYPCGHHWSRKASKTIASWSGKHYDYVLLDRSQNFTLVK